MEASHIFDLLKQWASLPDHEVEKLVSAENIVILKAVVNLLGDPRTQYIIDDKNFANVVREMRNLYRDGSRSLGNAIIEGSDWVDQGQPEKAKEVYKKFLESCMSKFYRDIAQVQLEKLQSKGSE